MERNEAYFESRRCLRAPISDIFYAAHLLDRAATSMLENDIDAASNLVKKADMTTVREWTESLWGSAKENPQQVHYLRLRPIGGSARKSVKEKKSIVRMPNISLQKQLMGSNSYHCAYCSIPLVPVEVRKVFAKKLGAWVWGGSNISQNAALQCMWLQFDHVVPHSHGGSNDQKNLVISCAPCNYGKAEYLLEELGLKDPRQTKPVRTSWDGLTRLL